ncbi:MAG: pyridoxal-phosphate dependent enzyme [Planctomycetota bacterium]|jgi:1-aminocyclopropane-1-carboxylate deaminase/D-cysteine desulfhydrase-like pyridoxal-dependent ACC family enzyme
MISEDELYRKVESACRLKSADSFNLRSRIHRLRWFNRSDIWIKRDDELSFGVSGTRLRKHASIVPVLKLKGIEEVVVLGGANSNNVLSAAQILTENNIKITPFLLGPPAHKQGNLKLLSLFVDDDEIHWISHEQWADIESHVNEYVEKENERGIKAFVLPEGGHHRMALPGSLSILLDILRNESESGITFDHVFIDSSTGMVAQSLLAGAAAINKKTKFHIVALTGSFETFECGLNQIIQYTEDFLQGSIELRPDYKLYYPATAKSIRDTERSIFREIKSIARNDGIFTDPVYSAKLFITAKQTIQDLSIDGNILLIHSGGTLALSGFMDYPVSGTETSEDSY